LPDMTGFEFLEPVGKLGLHGLPIIVYTAKELSKDQEMELKKAAQRSILKVVRSPERLLDETALSLHRVAAQLPEVKRQIVENLHQTDAVLAGKKVLIVDDDLRNLFAITSVLERHSMEVISAETGKEAIHLLESTPR